MSKFINYNSAEKAILQTVFDKIPLMDKYIANIIEEYIYGTVKTFYSTGELKEEYITKYRVKNGEYKRYHKNGKISVKTTYLNGKKEGVYKVFYDNGNLKLKTTFKKGKLEGLYVSWYKSDLSCILCFYKGGKKEGKCRIFDEFGFEEEYDFRLINECNYINGKKEGTCFMRINQATFHKLHYDEFNYENEDKDYTIKIEYKNDKKNGSYIVKYADVDQIRKECYYKDNIVVGKVKEYHSNGRFMSTYYCNSLGTICGLYRVYNKEGELIIDVDFDKYGYDTSI